MTIQLLTEEEAARRLLMSARSLRDLRQAGQIRYVAITKRKIAYRPEDCDEYVQSHLRIEEAKPSAVPKGRRRSICANPSAKIIPFSQRNKAR